MADKKVSEMDIVTSLKVTMYIPVIAPDEALAENRNKRFTIAQLLGALTPFTGTSQTFASIPQVYAFRGTSQCTATLPSGSDDIVNMPLVVVNLGTADLIVQPDGSDPLQGSDPFSIPSGDEKMYVFKWTGATDGWIVS